MLPVISIGALNIGPYQMMALAGGLTAGVFASRKAKRRGYDENDMIALLLIAAAGAIVGGHILYGLTNIPLYPTVFANLDKITSFGAAWQIIVYLFGGMVFYGGLLGGLAAGWVFICKRGLDRAGFTDIAAMAIPLFHAFGRVGCFLGGCCYGVESHIGFTYTHAPIHEANGVQRFPVQLCEAAFNLLLFLLLYTLYRRGRFSGRLLGLYFLIYPVGRFILEFWRGDEVRGFIGVLSTSQFISVVLFLCAGIYLLRTRRRPLPA